MGAILAWKAGEESETLTESTWERGMQLLGTETYDKNRKKNASETSTGQKTIRKYLKRLETTINSFQRKLVTQDRTERTLKGTVIMVPADTLALLTLKPVIDRTFGILEPETGTSYSGLSRQIGKAVEIELNFRHWIASSRESASEYAKANGMTKTPTSLAERLVLNEGISRASLFRWKKSFDELNKYLWSELEEYYCGDTLLNACAEALPECFEIHSPWRKGHPRKMVRMLPAFLKVFEESEIRYANNQTIKKPMLTKPHPWRLAE